jgi:hypothetical protein
VTRTLLALAFVTGLASCNGRISSEECTQMLDKYLDMTIAAESDGDAQMSAAELAAARAMKKALRKSDPAYQRVTVQCEQEVKRSEFRCAMKANTPETWQACID